MNESSSVEVVDFVTVSDLCRSEGQVGMFLPFGLGAVLCNAIIILAVRSHAFLRQRREYQIITALAFADFIEGKKGTPVLSGCGNPCVL